MKIILAIAFYFLHWGVCFLGTGTDRKNLISLDSYPEAVQKRVREDPALAKNAPKTKNMAVVWFGNFLLFTVVFSGLGLALKGAPCMISGPHFGISLPLARAWDCSIFW